MAYIRKDKGRWRAEVERKGVRKSKTFDTKSAATQWAALEEAEIIRADGKEYPAKTFGQALARYGEEVSSKKKTEDAELKRIAFTQREFPSLCAKVISEITTPDLVAWRDKRLKTITPGAVRRDANMLRNVFAVARDEWHWCGESPFKGFKVPSDNAPRARRVESIAGDRMKRIRDALRMGYVENQTVAQMVQRVRGTRAKGYADGIIEIDRRNAEAMVRTAISHTAAVTRDAFIDANADLVKAVQWVSTLDNRTSSPCRLRDGLKYTHDTHKPVGHKVPWGAGPGALHWCCRSTCCPVLKSWRELGIPMDDLAAGDRSSMDGQVAADLTYSEWLVKQTPARQDEILGATRGRLLRAGTVKPGDFYSNKGVFLTLDQLRERDAAALV